MIKPSVYNKLTRHGRTALRNLVESANLSASDQELLNLELKTALKTPGLHLLLAIFLPINHFLNKQIAVGLLFFLTCGGFGVWYLVHIFTSYFNARKVNDATAANIASAYRVARA